MSSSQAAQETLVAEPAATAAAEPAKGPRPATSPAHPDWADRADGLGWWTRTKFGVVRAFLLNWARLFGLDGLHRFGRFFGYCEYLIDHNRRRRVSDRLQRVFPEGLDPLARRAIIRRYFQRIRCDKMFYTIFDRLPREQLLARIAFPGRAALDAALARGRGVYVAMSHTGSHHVAAMIMALLGYRLAGVRDRNEGALRRYIQRQFAETFPAFCDFRMFFADAFPREIYRCYKDGFVVASALDVSVERVSGERTGGERGGDNKGSSRLKTCPVRLFGETQHFLSGPVQMAIRCGAPVLQGFVISHENFRYELRVHGQLVDPQVDDESQPVLARALQQYADGIAEVVREFPCHLSRI